MVTEHEPHRREQLGVGHSDVEQSVVVALIEHVGEDSIIGMRDVVRFLCAACDVLL